MKDKGLLKTAVIIGLSGAIIILLFMFGPFSPGSDTDRLVRLWKAKGKHGKLTVIYPGDGTLFPPEIISPVFTWKDKTENVDSWLIVTDFNGKTDVAATIKKNQEEKEGKPEWKPSVAQWDTMKQQSTENVIRVAILGYRKQEPAKLLSAATVSIHTSKDKVGASIFYRDVPLPFLHAYKNLEDIRWRLGDISVEGPTRLMLSNLPICGNCHSFTKDGRTLAMDVDYGNDKGSYVISKVEKTTSLTSDNIITWSDYRKGDGESTFGLLSQISPDGRYVISTVKDRSIFVPKDDLHYSQLFFPLKGILVYYNRQTAEYHPLPGADDPVYVQSNPSWTPDGKTIIFAKAKAVRIEAAEKSKSVLVTRAVAAQFLEGKREFKYDLYRIPFNDGKGGTPEPIPGASNNGKSNYFPRISPDGKWLVFCKADNFMLLQPDSRLYIMPVSGGTPREMICNTSNMNSWHSWSPNSRWLVFASKQMGPYTQLFLTHIDENGIDTPPVLLRNFILPKRAINIPEFVDITLPEWEKMVDEFSDSNDYYTRIGEDKFFAEDYKGAIDFYNKAIDQNPKNSLLYVKRADAKAKVKDYDGSLQDYDKSIQMNPSRAMAYVNRGNVRFIMGEYRKAIEDYEKALRVDASFAQAYDRRGHARFRLNDFKGAIADLDKAIELSPQDPALFANRAYLKSGNSDFDGAVKDYSEAIRLRHDYIGAYVGRGDVKLKMHDIPGAENDYRKALEMEPKTYTALMGIGNIHLRKRELDKAEKMFDKVLELEPGHWEAYIGKGDSRFRMGDLKGAVSAYTEAVNLNPNAVLAYDRRATVRNHLKDFKGALKDLGEAIRLNPGHFQYYSDRGDIRFELSDLNGALGDYSLAIKLKTEDPVNYYKRAMIKLRLGQKDSGCKDLHKARDLGYKDASKYIEKYCGN